MSKKDPRHPRKAPPIRKQVLGLIRLLGRDAVLRGFIAMRMRNNWLANEGKIDHATFGYTNNRITLLRSSVSGVQGFMLYVKARKAIFTPEELAVLDREEAKHEPGIFFTPRN